MRSGNWAPPGSPRSPATSGWRRAAHRLLWPLEELDRVRGRGYAFNREVPVDGLAAAAVPVLRGDTALAALAVVGPSRRLTGAVLEERIPDLLHASANELELNLAYAADEGMEHVVE